jgi:hypothetical protein
MPTWLANGEPQRLPVHKFGVIMRISASISEMKNLCPPAQLQLNHRRHDVHISVIISSVLQ